MAPVLRWAFGATHSRYEPNPNVHMKPFRYLLLLLTAVSFGFATVACNDNDGPMEDAGEKVDDALDRRPAEGARDAIEDATQ